MPVIPVTLPTDPRLADYLDVRERQLNRAFREHTPGHTGGDPDAPFGKFMAEGDLVLERLLGSPFPLVSVLCTPTRIAGLGPLASRIPPAVPVYVVEPAVLERTVGFHLHRGLLAIAARTPPRDVATLAAGPGPRTLLVLEDLTNHDNIGALFRNAAAFGVDAVLLTGGCADPLYRKAVRVSMGHALRVPFARCQSVPAGLESLHAAGFHSLALTPRQPAIDLRALTLPPDCAARLALVVGSEGPGLTPAAAAAARQRVRIPMAGDVDSLNVAVAAAVALEHIRHLTHPSASGHAARA